MVTLAPGGGGGKGGEGGGFCNCWVDWSKEKSCDAGFRAGLPLRVEPNLTAIRPIRGSGTHSADSNKSEASPVDTPVKRKDNTNLV